MFASTGGLASSARETFLRRERRAAAKFAARDAAAVLASDAAAATSPGHGVRSSSAGDARDSLFGGHANGGGLVEDAVPAFSASRGELSARCPRRAPPARRRPKQIRLERDAKRRGKDGVRLAREKKSDALVSARALAEEGRVCFSSRWTPRSCAGTRSGSAAARQTRAGSRCPVEYTPELRRDMRLLKLRGAYGPEAVYKTDDTSKLPKNFQIGTVVEGAQDFYAARLTRKERKRTLTEEVLADADIKAVRKKRFAKIQAAKAHTAGLKEKRKLGGRARGTGGNPAAQKSTKRVKR